jgi:hypothetical protein
VFAASTRLKVGKRISLMNIRLAVMFILVYDESLSKKGALLCGQ